MENAEPVEIRPLEPALREDYLAFFDRDAFADNPEWASCYCFFNQAPRGNPEWDQRTGAQNRADAARYVDQGLLRGYLAYAGGRPIGWCNANLRSRYPTLDAEEASAAGPVGAIVCFIVAKPYRRQGIARRLLEAACEGFRQQGVRLIEAYPRQDPRSEAARCHGPLAMYLAAGFEVVREAEGVAVVRKRL